MLTTFAQSHGQTNPGQSPGGGCASQERTGVSMPRESLLGASPNRGQTGDVRSCLTEISPTTQYRGEAWSSRGRARHFSSASARQYDVRRPGTGTGQQLNRGRWWEVARTCLVGLGAPEAQVTTSTCHPRWQPLRASRQVPGRNGIGSYSRGRTGTLTYFMRCRIRVSPARASGWAGTDFSPTKRGRTPDEPDGMARAACWCNSGTPHFSSPVQP